MNKYYIVLTVAPNGKTSHHNILSVGALSQDEARRRFASWKATNGWKWGNQDDKRIYSKVPFKYESFKNELFV